MLRVCVCIDDMFDIRKWEVKIDFSFISHSFLFYNFNKAENKIKNLNRNWNLTY